MPIVETEAKLWHATQEERDHYDDLMMSNIELKSENYDDENFSPVFNRKTQEFFLEPSEKFLKDFQRMLVPQKGKNDIQLVDEYLLKKPDHTWYRAFSQDKFVLGFFGSYFLLRELPIRNFYARCVVMYFFVAKMFDNIDSYMPFSGLNFRFVMTNDEWNQNEQMNFNQAFMSVRSNVVPSVLNEVGEGKRWMGKQPAHMERADYYHFSTMLNIFSSPHQAAWDGTMNQPIMRLADPKHKDSYMLTWF